VQQSIVIVLIREEAIEASLWLNSGIFHFQISQNTRSPPNPGHQKIVAVPHILKRKEVPKNSQEDNASSVKQPRSNNKIGIQRDTGSR
jgi:hypothetical protein